MSRLWLAAVLIAPWPTPVQASSGADAAFALALHGQLAPKPGNVLFSPYSVASALSLARAGARGGTARELALVADPSDFDLTMSSAQFKAANALWLQKGTAPREEFLSSVRQRRGAEIKDADFRAAPEAARRAVNRWVEERTARRIKDLMAPGSVNRATSLVLANAVHFKGAWKSKFKKEATRREPFFAPGSRQAFAMLMTQTGKFPYLETPELQLIELPYAGGRLSMLVLLPRSPAGMRDLEVSLTEGGLAQRIADMEIRKIAVFLPRFKFSSGFELRPALAGLGIKAAFSPSEADFSGITGGRGLFISAAAHKAFIEVNEEGTEAAAATGMGFQLTSVDASPRVFRADRPFLFLIRDRETGTILFLGRLENPS